ncbi:DUF6368 family protein [Streptomyces sp. ID05-26A]|nr:DUF6368 family protein [Streptomyces sp. ID05-26A]
MPGPTLVVELAEPLSETALRELEAFVRRHTTRFERPRAWFFDVSISLGHDEARPFLIHLLRQGDDVFEAEHADEHEVEEVLGFKPVQAVNISAGCNAHSDHIAAALLTAAIMDVVGGVASAELLAGQVVTGLPGVLGVTAGTYPTALGTAEFLRAWVAQPGFRLLK